ncbi:MAG: 16S rRNA (cytosine(1402)-N(4))-methyltransferase RsmH [Pirellulaceae bacterium]
MAPSNPIHVPVLAEEVLEWLKPEPGQTLVDGTLGGGGHTGLLAERVAPNGMVISLDRDLRAVESARDRLAELPVRVVQADFREIPSVLAELGLFQVHGVLLDLGLSSDQLADDERGFSFDAGGTLDLRFDISQGEPAWRLLNRLNAERLADILFHWGEERFSRRIARNIVETRRSAPIRTAAQLADLVRRCVPRSRNHPIDPATRTFQALRIAVNDELGALEQALEQIPDCLQVGGRLAVISFHSLEDRRVKRAFRGDSRYMILTKKPIRPIQSEVLRNPRSRSAKLRVAERAPVSN